MRYVRQRWADCSPEGYALACEWLEQVDAREQAKTMHMPTLIMLGSNEGQAFKDAAQWMHANIPASAGIVEVPQAGHASVRERAGFAIDVFRRFLG